MAEVSKRLPPPPFWRTRYFALEVMVRPDRREIDVLDVKRALFLPARKQRQRDGRLRLWYRVDERQRWLRVVTEPDGADRSQHILGQEFRAVILEPVIRYYPETDTMAIEIRPWPVGSGDRNQIGGEDAGEDLVITVRRTENLGFEKSTTLQSIPNLSLPLLSKYAGAVPLRRSAATRRHFSTAVFDQRGILGAKQIADRYLLALAVKHGGRLVAFDQAIRPTAVRGAAAAHVVQLPG